MQAPGYEPPAPEVGRTARITKEDKKSMTKEGGATNKDRHASPGV